MSGAKHSVAERYVISNCPSCFAFRWQLAQGTNKKGYELVVSFVLRLMPSHRLAERTGFEPAEAVNLARFPSVCLKPLDHLSICGANLICSNIIPNVTQIVNTIQANFPTFSAILWQKQPILRNTSTAGRFCKFLCNAGQMQKELLHASNVLFQ